MPATMLKQQSGTRRAQRTTPHRKAKTFILKISECLLSFPMNITQLLSLGVTEHGSFFSFHHISAHML